MATPVLGRTVDEQTRCVHYSTPADVVAIKFKCCGSYYPCFDCHRECAGHPAEQWPADQWAEKAILCGVCQMEISINTYLGVHSCPHCGAEFNPGCKLHRHLYFSAASDANNGSDGS